MKNKKKNKEDEEEKKAGTMEQYVLKLLKTKQIELEKFREEIKKDFKGNMDLRLYGAETFQRISGQIDILYIILTGHSNPINNPEDDK